MKKYFFTLFTLLTLAGFSSVYAQTNVVFYTTEGDFMVEIRDDIAPITGGNFLDLVEDEFYDGIIFHRVIDGFIIQGGDPTGTGTGGPGYTIEDEFHPELSNVQKTISMANTGAPDSGGSQFFFNMVDNTYLDYDEEPLTSKHAVFGTVIENFNVVEDIAGVPVNASNRPLTDVVIDSIRVTDVLLTGIAEENQITSRVKIYPNPINENSVISIEATKPAQSTVELYDAFGKLVGTLNNPVIRRNEPV